MSSLTTKPHNPDCRKRTENGITVYVCVGDCPAMGAYLVQPGEVTGEVDAQPELTAEAADIAARLVNEMLGR